MGDAWSAGDFPISKEVAANLESIVYVHNLQTDIIGENQIKTVFDPEYERIHNLEGYDHIWQYYFQPGKYDTDDSDDSDQHNDEDHEHAKDEDP